MKHLTRSVFILFGTFFLASCGSSSSDNTAASTAAPAAISYAYADDSMDDSGAVEIEEESSENSYSSNDEDNSSSAIPTYHVTWKNDNSNVLEEDDVLAGEMPSYDGNIPKKSGSESYYYTFVGWFPKVDVVTRDITYTATYKDISNYDSYGLHYEEQTDGYYVSCGNAKYYPETIIIPKTHKGRNIIGISSSGFNGCFATTIVVPNTVKYIGSEAFRSCLDLTTIVLPNTIETIGNNAFYSCTHLKDIDLGSSIESIGNNAFENCISLENVSISSGSLSSLGGNAFRNCISLKTAVLPSGITSFGYNIFDGCMSLESITTPFYGYLSSLFGSTAFDDSIKIDSYYIPKSLKKVVINGGSNYIGSHAFEGLSNITSIEFLTGNIETIGQEAFSDCTGLTSITIPYGVTTIETNAFFNCNNLKTFNASYSSLQTIGQNVFNSCRSLETVTLPDSLEEIGNYAFRNCENLRNISIPNSLKKIGRGVFSNCDKISYNTYKGAYYLGNEYNPYYLLVKAKAKDMTTFEMHPETRIIGDYAFYDCVLLSSIDIPNNVISIGYNAFQNCVSLTTVNIGSSVKNIYSGAFYGCSNIKTLIIPNTVTYLDDGVFSGLSSLITLVTPITTTSSTLYFGTLFGSNSYDSSYSANSYYIPTSLQNIYFNKVAENLPIFRNFTSIQTFIVPKGVQRIPSYAFSGCTNLRTVTLPSSLQTIEYSAFASCSQLTNVNYEGSSKSNVTIEYSSSSYSSYYSGNSTIKNANWSCYYSYSDPYYQLS